MQKWWTLYISTISLRTIVAPSENKSHVIYWLCPLFHVELPSAPFPFFFIVTQRGFLHKRVVIKVPGVQRYIRGSDITQGTLRYFPYLDVIHRLLTPSPFCAKRMRSISFLLFYVTGYIWRAASNEANVESRGEREGESRSADAAIAQAVLVVKGKWLHTCTCCREISARKTYLHQHCHCKRGGL